MWPSTAKRRSTASRCFQNFRSTKSATVCRATHADDHARFIEAVVSTAQRRGARRQHLSAQRQSSGYREIHLQDWMDEAPVGLCARTADARRAVDPRRRLQRHSHCRRRAQSADLGQRCPLPAAHARRISGAGQSRPYRRRACDERRRPAFIRSGTTKRELGRKTTASASITCCCRLRPPTGSATSASIATFGRGRSRPTTCRSGSILISRENR